MVLTVRLLVVAAHDDPAKLAIRTSDGKSCNDHMVKGLEELV
jgi:hypothetical protein